MPKCTICQVEKEQELFYRREKGFRKECSDCHNKYTTSRVNERRKQNIAYKGGKCQICGHDNIFALEFHHKDKNSKSFSISYKKFKSFESIKEEIDKCDLLCRNCHRLNHRNNDDLL